MRRLILLAFIGAFLTRDVTLSKVHEYPTNLEWFDSNKLRDNEEEKRTVCETKECKKIANTILKSMNRSVDPCDDFYEYACGNWPNKNPLPKGIVKMDMMHQLQLKANKQAKAITAADFQSPWFSYERPRSVNFGIIGFIIAHEVNHGFDDTGHLYDKDGEYLEGWFLSMAYDKREECFVNQFNNYFINEKKKEKIENYGKQAIADIIADSMGLQAIFKTYERKEKESETPDAALPGMEDFTNNQLFFLFFANLWCEAVDPNKLIEIAKKDTHSINRLKIIGSVSNSNDFARAYNCPVGSPMNPEKKCYIWK